MTRPEIAISDTEQERRNMVFLAATKEESIDVRHCFGIAQRKLAYEIFISNESIGGYEEALKCALAILAEMTWRGYFGGTPRKKIIMEEILQEILEWYKNKSSPNDRFAYHRCPICDSTWWGNYTGVGEQHNRDCWIPRLQRVFQQGSGGVCANS